MLLIDNISVWWTWFCTGIKWRIISILPDLESRKSWLHSLELRLSRQVFKATFQQFNTSTYRRPEELLPSVQRILYLLVDLAAVQSNCRVTASSQYTQRQSLGGQPLSSAWHFYLHCFCYPSPAGLHLRSDPEFTSFSMSPPQKPLIIPSSSQNRCLLWTREYKNITFPTFTLSKERFGALFFPHSKLTSELLWISFICKSSAWLLRCFSPELLAHGPGEQQLTARCWLVTGLRLPHMLGCMTCSYQDSSHKYLN